jgi:hypothetical protein
MNNDEIISYLIEDLNEMIPYRESFSDNDLDGFYDYLSGVIERSQSVLRMMGVPEDKIPTDGSC